MLQVKRPSDSTRQSDFAPSTEHLRCSRIASKSQIVNESKRNFSRHNTTEPSRTTPSVSVVANHRNVRSVYFQQRLTISIRFHRAYYRKTYVCDVESTRDFAIKNEESGSPFRSKKAEVLPAKARPGAKPRFDSRCVTRRCSDDCKSYRNCTFISNHDESKGWACLGHIDGDPRTEDTRQECASPALSQMAQRYAELEQRGFTLTCPCLSRPENATMITTRFLGIVGYGMMMYRLDTETDRTNQPAKQS